MGCVLGRCGVLANPRIFESGGESDLGHDHSTRNGCL